MVERQIELRRRRSRRKKMRKLKGKLTVAKTPGDREQIVKRIQKLSPWWQAPQNSA